MKKKFIILVASIFLVNVMVSTLPLIAHTQGEGGVVQTKGEVFFYEDSMEPSSSSTSTDPQVVKPAKRLPLTGEAVLVGATFSGLLLLLLVLFLWWKRRKGVNEEGGE